MNKFESYNASYIVPQRTLLEKFNKLIDYLKANPSVNLYYVNDDYEEDTTYNLSDVVLNNHELQLGDLVVFKNIYYAYVSTIGDTTFTVSGATLFRGEQGFNISNVALNDSNQFVITLENGTSYTTQAITFEEADIYELVLEDVQFNSEGQADLTISEEEYNRLVSANTAKIRLILSDETTNIELFRIHSDSLITFGGSVGFTTYYITMVNNSGTIVASAYEQTIVSANEELPSGEHADLDNIRIGNEYYPVPTYTKLYKHQFSVSFTYGGGIFVPCVISTKKDAFSTITSAVQDNNTIARIFFVTGNNSANAYNVGWHIGYVSGTYYIVAEFANSSSATGTTFISTSLTTTSLTDTVTEL